MLHRGRGSRVGLGGQHRTRRGGRASASSLSLGKGEKGGSPAKEWGWELLLVAPIMPTELTPSPTPHPA